MPELDVIRHVIRPHTPFGSEDYDPGSDMLVVVHKNPENPDDPTEFGHHIRLQGLAYRKEMWGLPDYASTIDMELKDLERFYARERDEDYGVHPLAQVTEHYFEAPPVRMQSFSPDYVMDRMDALAVPSTREGAMRMAVDVVMVALDDVKNCLAGPNVQSFPCRGMTGLSTDSVKARNGTMARMQQQTRRLKLISSGPLDAVRQMLTDREPELEKVRKGFVDHVLIQGNVPEIMRKRVMATAARRGPLEGNA